MADEADNCPAIANPDQADADADGIGDACAPVVQQAVAPLAEEPVIEPAATGTLRIRKGGDRGAGNAIQPLAGAYFNVYRDDGDGNFEPGTGDSLEGNYGPTNASGYVDVVLTIASGDDDFWVQEASISTAGWNVITQVAVGNNNAAGTTVPYAERYDLNSGQTTQTRQFVNRRDNNSFPDVCGLKVALVFDRSGSIDDDTEYVQMKAAGKLFVDALTGTPSQIGIYSFSESATQNLAFTSVASAGPGTGQDAQDVKNAIDALPPTSGGTNWDAAFRAVQGDGADVIILLTDGNPTVNSVPATGTATTVDVVDIENGVASANLAKLASAQPKVIAVGIGTALSPLNLQLVSGPNVNDDYYVSGFETLGSTLFEIATKLCGGTVTVLKEVPDGQGGWQPAENWTFSAASSGPAPTPQSGQTNVNGVVNFDFNNLNDVTATITETVKSGFQLVQQSGKNAVCKIGDTPVSVSNTANGVSFTLGETDIATCTFRNQPATGKLEVVKDLIPDSDPGKFNLQIDGATAGTGANVGDGGTTGEQTLNTGTHTVGETAGTGTDLANYTKSIECKDANGTGSVVAGPSQGAGPLNVTVTSGSDIVCIITNTRQTGKLEVVKDLIPDSDPGHFNLQIDGATAGTGANVGDGGTTGEQTLNTGTHTVGETAGTGTDLANYTKSIECKDANGTGSVVAGPSQGAGPLNVTVTSGSDIVCVITNTRQTGKLEVVKDLIPDSDPGKFNLQIDGATAGTGANVGDGGTTGEQTLNTGTHTVGETAGTGTDLANYTKSIECKDANGTGSVVAGPSQGAGPLNVTVTSGSDIVCVITNTRQTGKLEVVKDLIPDSDPGKFNLQIDGATAGTGANVGDGGTTGEQTLNTGTHTVGETAGTGTDLGDYTKSIECKDANGTGSVVAGPSQGAGPLNVTVTSGSDIVCVITNTRQTGKLEVVKDLIPDSDPGKFNLQIDGATAGTGANVGDGGTTGEQTLNTGTHTVGETAGTGTDLANYTKSIECKDANGTGSVVAGPSQGAGPLNVTVTSGSDIVCVITNKLIELTIDKTVKAGFPTYNSGTGEWTIKYDIEVENTGAAGTTYDLSDVPTFGAGVTIVSGGIKVESAQLGAPIDPYTPGNLIVDDESIAAGVTHTYTVTVRFTIAGSATSVALDCELGTGENGTGTLNTATVIYNGKTIQDKACEPLPNLTIDKTVKAGFPTYNSGTGEWTIKYDIEVENTGAAGTTYDLSDVPTFGAGVTIVSGGIKVESAQLGAPIDSYTPGNLIVDDESIAAGVTHTYTVTVRFTIAGSATSVALDCELGTGENGTGTLNTATATWEGGTLEDKACEPLPNLTIDKTVKAGFPT